jgi:hypothetical protein
MPTKYYSADNSNLVIKAAEEKGLVEVLCRIESAGRKVLTPEEWMHLDMMAFRELREKPQYEVRDPLQLRFQEEVGSTGALITDALLIKAIFEDYGVENEQGLVGKPVMVCKRNTAKPGEPPLGCGAICFYRPE